MVEKRGRKSAADDVNVVALMDADAKPSPPEDITEWEKVLWRSIVDACPPRWFGRETWPVLRGLCRHQLAADITGERYIAALLAKKKPEVIETLARQYYRETHAVRHHSADLRLTKITRIANQVHADRQKANQVLQKPWEI